MNPLLPVVLLIAATVVLAVTGRALLKVQSASKVISWVVPSEKVPVAVNWVLKPLWTDGAGGEIVMVESVVSVTVILKVAVTTAPDAFVMVAVTLTVPAALTVTHARSGFVNVVKVTPAESLVHTTWPVMSLVNRPR